MAMGQVCNEWELIPHFVDRFNNSFFEGTLAVVVFLRIFLFTEDKLCTVQCLCILNGIHSLGLDNYQSGILSMHKNEDRGVARTQQITCMFQEDLQEERLAFRWIKSMSVVQRGQLFLGQMVIHGDK
jgi:hypothetical protein